MTEQSDKTQDRELEPFFAAARAHAPEPSTDLLARIAAGAEASIPRAGKPELSRRSDTGGWRGILAGFGGWPALAGLATAAVAGVWIGYADPTTALLGFGADDVTYGLDELLPGYGAAEAWSG